MILLSIISLAISGSHGSFIMLLFLLLIAGVSFVMLILSRLGLECNQELSNGLIMKGDSTRYQALIYCKLPAFAFVKATSKAPSKALTMSSELALLDKEFELLGKAQVHFEYGIHATYRCVSEVGIESVEMYDFLKIFKLRKQIKDNPILIVCPDVVPFSDELFSISPSQEAGTSRKASFEDYSSITDVRKYEYSDSMKRVHWKLSAKKNELMVKNYDHTNTMVTAIIVDNRKTADTIKAPEILEDKLIETAVSICKFNLDDNYPVMIDFMDNKAPSRAYEAGSAGFDKLFFAAASIRIDEDYVEPLFDEYYNPNFLISTLYVMTTNPDQKVNTFLKNMSTTGLDANLIHFYEDDKAEKSKEFEESGVSYFGIKAP